MDPIAKLVGSKTESEEQFRGTFSHDVILGTSIIDKTRQDAVGDVETVSNCVNSQGDSEDTNELTKLNALMQRERLQIEQEISRAMSLQQNDDNKGVSSSSERVNLIKEQGTVPTIVPSTNRHNNIKEEEEDEDFETSLGETIPAGDNSGRLFMLMESSVFNGRDSGSICSGDDDFDHEGSRGNISNEEPPPLLDDNYINEEDTALLDFDDDTAEDFMNHLLNHSPSQSSNPTTTTTNNNKSTATTASSSSPRLSGTRSNHPFDRKTTCFGEVEASLETIEFEEIQPFSLDEDFDYDACPPSSEKRLIEQFAEEYLGTKTTTHSPNDTPDFPPATPTADTGLHSSYHSNAAVPPLPPRTSDALLEESESEEEDKHVVEEVV